MMKSLQNTISVIVAASYLVVATSAVVEIIRPSYTSAGPAAIAMHGGKTNELPVVSFTQRRHVPLVKPLVVPADHECPLEYPSGIERSSVFSHASQAVPFFNIYFRCISDRAPPRG
jgi:hypothetical protein